MKKVFILILAFTVIIHAAPDYYTCKAIIDRKTEADSKYAGNIAAIITGTCLSLIGGAIIISTHGGGIHINEDGWSGSAYGWMGYVCIGISLPLFISSRDISANRKERRVANEIAEEVDCSKYKISESVPRRSWGNQN